MLEMILSNDCAICGEDDPLVLDFDHIDPGCKRFGVSRACAHKRSVFLDEVYKCRLLCVRCHRHVTFGATGGMRWRFCMEYPDAKRGGE